MTTTDFNKPAYLRNPELYSVPLNERRAWEASALATEGTDETYNAVATDRLIYEHLDSAVPF